MAQAQNKLAESFKAFSDFKIPSYDFEALLSIGQRNIKALTAANQAFAEGAQAIVKRRAEIARKNATEAAALFREACSSKTPEACVAKQSEFIRSAYENALAGSRELFEMASKSSIEATEALTSRLTEVIGEVGSVAKKAKKSSI